MDKKTLKEELIEFNNIKGWGTKEGDLLESFTHCFCTVWQDDYIDVRRWYSLQKQVVQVYDRFWMHKVYLTTGDNNASDMGLKPQLIDDIIEVYPKTIKTTIYETKES